MYLFLLILATVALFIPIAYLPTPYNASATYFSEGAVTSGPGFYSFLPDIYSGFLYVVGLIIGTMVLLIRWESSRATIAAGSLMVADIVLTLWFVSFVSNLSRGSTCYYQVPDIGLVLALSVILLYTVGGVKLQKAQKSTL